MNKEQIAIAEKMQIQYEMRRATDKSKCPTCGRAFDKNFVSVDNITPTGFTITKEVKKDE